MTRAPATTAHTDAAPPRRVSHRHDATERQADRAADIVARGGSVTGWSFASVPAEASVHRDEEEKKKPVQDPTMAPPTPKSTSDSLVEGLGKAGEAALKSKPGREVQDKVTEIKPLAGAVAAGMLVAGKEVPIPLGKGVTLGVKVDGLTEGKVNSVGATLSWGGGSPKSATGKKAPVLDPMSEKLMASIRAQTEAHAEPPVAKPAGVGIPGLPTPKTPTPSGPGWSFSPFAPGAVPIGIRPLPGSAKKGDANADQAAPTEEPKKEDEIKRAPATATETASDIDTSGVDAATRGGGRALDPGLRHSMEARFGYDFSSVRLHDDPQAASAAAGVDAAAFTVGEHIVFASGRFDPSSPQGRHLIAHELAHVVQERGNAAPRTTGAPTRIHRLDVGNWFALLFGGEGTWTENELRSYLRKITAARAHEGWWESDNKARAIVRKWKAGTPGWELTGTQMALLTDEMLDGAVLDEDENAILDLLESASADELIVLFRDPPKRYAALNDAFDGAEQTRLDQLVTQRFAGGGKALEQGTVNVVGPALPVGSPIFPFDPAQFDARFEAEYYGLDPASVVEHFSPADRVKAREHVLRTTLPRWKGELDAATRARVKEKDPARLRELEKKEGKLDQRVRALDIFIAATLQVVPASPGEAIASTSAVTGPRAKAAREALTPPRPPKPTPAAPAPPPAAPASPPVSTTAPGVTQTKAERLAEAARKQAEAARRAKDEAARKKAEAERKAKEAAERKAMFAPGGKYRTLVAATLAKIITDAYDAALKSGKAAGTTEIERMAEPAKNATDEVFASFYGAGTRPELTFGGATPTLFSWHDRQTRAVRSAKPDERVNWALDQIRYYFRSDEAFDAINAECDAHPQTVNNRPNEEAQALEAVAQATVSAGVSDKWENDPQTTADKLIFIDRNWGGAQTGGKIYVDMLQSGKVDEDRRARWDMFQTLIHEYGHTLAHADYRTYAGKLKRTSDREWNTLMEGVDSLLTDVVWARSGRKRLADKPTRVLVEGAAWAALPPIAMRPPSAYASITEAQRLVDLVGADNVWTAYFLGKVDRIGAKADGSPP
ncbi:DUF4157 domain-containing protein [Microbacterium sp. SS28]|uniref:eCIS core domain-containing protein n=1 Tax=Microbacterium sp. SS28 TaxID=2919948 RepID=UPI001FA9A6C0|nr:DUF4157 domain-containing protein [Microbacterium sp. SS28]